MTGELMLLLAVMIGLLIAIVLVLRGRVKSGGSVNELLLSKTFSLLVEGEKEAALGHLRRLYTRMDHDVGIGLALGILSRHLGKNLVAVRTHRSLASRPGIDDELRAMIYTQLGADYLACGLLDRARAALTEAQTLAKVNELMARIGQQVHLRLQDWDAAFKLVNDYGKKAHADVSVRLGLIRYEQGRHLWEKGQPDEALAAFKRAISAHPGCLPAFLGIARGRRLLDKPAKAQAYLVKHLKAFNDHFWTALAELKECAVALEQPEVFLTTAQHRLEEEPRDWQSRAVLAAYLEDTGESDKAVTELLTCLESAPQALLLHRRMLLLSARQPPSGSVLQRYLKALDPNEVFGHLYDCKACFYSTPEMLWSCPSCHQDYCFGPRGI